MAIYYEMRVICEKIGLSPKTLRVWMEEGLIAPRREGRRYLFNENDLKRLLLIRRLRNDLGVNLAGIDIILQLLDRIASLEEELAMLRQQIDTTKELPT